MIVAARAFKFVKKVNGKKLDISPPSFFSNFFFDLVQPTDRRYTWTSRSRRRIAAQGKGITKATMSDKNSTKCVFPDFFFPNPTTHRFDPQQEILRRRIKTKNKFQFKAHHEQGTAYFHRWNLPITGADATINRTQAHTTTSIVRVPASYRDK